MESVVKKRYLIFIALVLLLFVCVTFITYARQVWQSPENTTFDTTIGDIAGVRFINGDSINVTNLGPVLDYRDSANVEFGIYNRTNGTINVSVGLNITSISSSLQSSSFKWVLERMNSSNVYEVIASGDFSSAIIGSNSIISGNSITTGSSYTYYKLYVYIDGSVSNDASMMNSSMNSIVVIDAVNG